MATTITMINYNGGDDEAMKIIRMMIVLAILSPDCVGKQREMVLMRNG